MDGLPTAIRRDLSVVTTALLDVVEELTPLPEVAAHLAEARARLEAAYPEPATARSDDVEGAPEQLALLDALRSDDAEGLLPVGPLRVDALRLRATDTGGRVEVVLSGGPAPLEVLLERIPEEEPAFLRTGPLALSYKSRDPAPTAAELEVLRGLLAHAAMRAGIE